MKKLIISVVLSVPLFWITSPSFANPTSSLDNPILRTDATSVINNNLPKSGATYAYWYRWHHWHRGNRWHRWHWHHWHRG